jgi:hypothetical protein
MSNLLAGQINAYRQNVVQVASQAAIHLHNQVGSIGTALFDRHGNLVFNNNALRYTTESAVVRLIGECLTDPAAIRQHTLENVTIYAVALDKQHVFIVAGSHFERSTVDHFLSSLRQVLPQSIDD